MRSAALLALLLALAACGRDPAPDAPPPGAAAEEAAPPGIPFRDDGRLVFLREGRPVVEIAVEIAETDSARTRGLMQRTGLPERSGMLFVFDREEPQGFWMANTPIALDLFFVSADSQVVSISKYARPFSPESIESAAPARFVVEVPAGFADTYGLIEGDRVRWQRHAAR